MLQARADSTVVGSTSYLISYLINIVARGCYYDGQEFILIRLELILIELNKIDLIFSS